MTRRRAAVGGAVVTAAVVAAIVIVGANGGVATTYARIRIHLGHGRTTTYDMPGSSHLATPGPAVSPPARALSVVVLGDSVPAGNLCGCTPFGERVARHIAAEQHRSVTVHNLAVGGATSRDVVEQLRRASARRQVADADLVVVETGANDFDAGDASDADCQDVSSCFGSQLAETTDNIADIATTVKGLLRNTSAQISLVGYWNVFTDGRVGRWHGASHVATSDALTRELNQAIRGIAEKQHLSYPDVYAAFKGADGSHDPTEYLVADGDHPNDRGHQLLADTVFAALGDSVRNL